MKIFILITLFFVGHLFGSGKVTLEYWTPFTGGDARPMQFIVDKYNNSQKNVIVRMKVIEWADYYPTLLKAIKEGNPPDIAIAHGSRLTELLADDAILPIEKMRLGGKSLHLTHITI